MAPGLFGASGGIPLTGRRSAVAVATLGDFAGRTVCFFRLEGGKHRGAIGVAEGEVIERAVRVGIECGVPVCGVVSTSGADVGEGVAALHAWGRVARALAHASGVVPTLVAVTGPCVSGPALLLGIADQVVMTTDAFAYVSGPDTVAEFTGVALDRHALGGSAVHERRSGLAALVVDDEDDALHALRDVLDHLPSNHLEDPPRLWTGDPLDRDCAHAAGAVPAAPAASYDVRDVITDVLDSDSFLELRPAYSPNVVTGLGRLDGRAVGVVANQPSRRAGTLDTDASRKAARFVQWCDAFNVAIVTFVDTPGFEPGRDLERRGMIRHGAQLVHAYAAATVPRLCVVLRKAYGGAYIVMDSKTLGNDWCAAWPTAEIAVMGASAAARILRDVPEQELDVRFATPYVAAERGYVDEVVAPTDTRRALGAALDGLATKREPSAPRPGRHSNTPL